MSSTALLRESRYPMVSMDEALGVIYREASNMLQKSSEVIRLSDSVGRFTSEDVYAPVDIPLHPCSRLDGYAVRAEEIVSGQMYPVISDGSRAGNIGGWPMPKGSVAWITTGGPLPLGANAVVPIEHTLPASSPLSVSAGGVGGRSGMGVASYIIVNGPPPALNSGIRQVGSDAAKGSLLAAAGTELTPAIIATLLSACPPPQYRVNEGATSPSAGLSSSTPSCLEQGCVKVYKRPRVGVLSTGDELVRDITPSSFETTATPPLHTAGTVGSAAASVGGSTAGSIVDTNGPMLLSLAATLGAQTIDFGVIRDSWDSTVKRLQELASFSIAAETSRTSNSSSKEEDASPLPYNEEEGGVDILITTGGVSMGDRDYIKPALETIEGCTVHFGRLMMKPGKPATFATTTAPSSTAGAAREGNNTSVSESAPPDVHGGVLKRKRMVFALPGNPVSAWVCFHTLIAPAIRLIARGGGEPRNAPRCAVSSSSFAKEATSVLTRSPPSWSSCLPLMVDVTLLDTVALDPERPEFHRAYVWWGLRKKDAEDSSASSSIFELPMETPKVREMGLFARSTGNQASSKLTSIEGANALLCLPSAATKLVAPTRVRALLVGPLLGLHEVPAHIRDRREVDFKSSSGGSCNCGTSISSPRKAAAAASEVTAHPSFGHQFIPLFPKEGSRFAVNVCILTVSDRCSSGVAVDKSGPAIAQALTATHPVLTERLDVKVIRTSVVPDEIDTIRRTVSSWLHTPLAVASVGEMGKNTEASDLSADLIITTGGTGFSPRDVTPEALRSLIVKPAPGLVHAMLAHGMKMTPFAALSRYEAGVVLKSNGCGALLIEMPGSVNAVLECLDAVAHLLPHVLQLIRE